MEIQIVRLRKYNIVCSSISGDNLYSKLAISKYMILGLSFIAYKIGIKTGN